MFDPLPGHVGDVQQAVDAAEIHESAVVGQVLDDTLDDVAFLQLLEQRLALRGVFLFDDGAPRDDHVVAPLVELDDLKLEALAFEIGRIADRTNVHQRTRQERADVVDLDRKTALDATVDHAFDHFTLLERTFELGPGPRPDRLLAREPRLAKTVLDGVQRHFDLVADGNLTVAKIVLELIDRDDGLGLEACTDDDDIVVDCHNGPGNDGTGFYLLTGKTLFK